MKNQVEIKKKLASNWFKFLQKKICHQFEKCQKQYNKHIRSGVETS